jgi:hypothetical protein
LGEEGGLNLYGFIGNDVLNMIDPFGLEVVTAPSPIEIPPSGPIPWPKIGPPQVIICTATFCCFYAGTYYICEKTGFHDKLAAKICKDDEKKKRCDKEWEDAFRECKKELAKPNPSPDFTGGYKNIMDCARGHVSEDCGGNPVDYGPKKKKPRKTYRFD